MITAGTGTHPASALTALVALAALAASAALAALAEALRHLPGRPPFAAGALPDGTAAAGGASAPRDPTGTSNSTRHGPC